MGDGLEIVLFGLSALRQGSGGDQFSGVSVKRGIDSETCQAPITFGASTLEGRGLTGTRSLLKMGLNVR